MVSESVAVQPGGRCCNDFQAYMCVPVTGSDVFRNDHHETLVSRITIPSRNDQDSITRLCRAADHVGHVRLVSWRIQNGVSSGVCLKVRTICFDGLALLTCRRRYKRQTTAKKPSRMSVQLPPL